VANSIYLSGSDAYAAGYEIKKDGMLQTAVYWKTGEKKFWKD
jgi:hypothetical protein